jgi:regulator of protease activity HflC (stomatin/prohibitin superfamily)
MYRESSTSGIADVVKKGSGTQVIVGMIILIIGAGFGLSLKSVLITYLAVAAVAAGFAIIISSFLIIIKQYDRAIILRLGKYQKRVGQGVRIRVPFADSVLVVDIREKVREFKAGRMLTRDNVPVTIDAILRYRVIEDRSKDAILNVENFNEMIQQVSQTTLRNNIGSALFQEVLSKRVDINNLIKSVIAQEATNWGIEVTGVEIRQVIIPQELENAMSMQAQAEREKNARVIFGESEIQVAARFVEASKIYANNPVAYALRQSNMLYESIKVQGNTIVLIPSENFSSMGFGNLAMSIAYLENTKKVIESDSKAASKAVANVTDK